MLNYYHTHADKNKQDMEHFDPTLYGKVFSSLIDSNRLNDLGVGQENTDHEKILNELNIATAFESHPVHDTDSANACLSALWLHHDFLDRSHQISQSISDSTGSFWHGIMHRREGDYWNSKYWFRQVGNHPVFSDLHAAVRELLQSLDSRFAPAGASSSADKSGSSTQRDRGNDKNADISEATKLAQQSSWDPFLYIDLVQDHIGSNTETETILKQIQRLEWWMLFDYCYRKSIGEVY